MKSLVTFLAAALVLEQCLAEDLDAKRIEDGNSLASILCPEGWKELEAPQNGFGDMQMSGDVSRCSVKAPDGTVAHLHVARRTTFGIEANVPPQAIAAILLKGVNSNSDALGIREDIRARIDNLDFGIMHFFTTKEKRFLEWNLAVGMDEDYVYWVISTCALKHGPARQDELRAIVKSFSRTERPPTAERKDS